MSLDECVRACGGSKKRGIDEFARTYGNGMDLSALFFCDNECGFSGSLGVVTSHEKCCTPWTAEDDDLLWQIVTDQGIGDDRGDWDRKAQNFDVYRSGSSVSHRYRKLLSMVPDGEDGVREKKRKTNDLAEDRYAEGVIVAVAERERKANDHRRFVSELKDNSVPIEDHGGTPVINHSRRVHYPAALDQNGNTVYPTLRNIQGDLTQPDAAQRYMVHHTAAAKDKNGQAKSKGKSSNAGQQQQQKPQVTARKMKLCDWVRRKCDAIDEDDVMLHPRTTHLLFWETKGTIRDADGGGAEGAQCLPWKEIDALQSHLSSLGVVEGAVVCNGGMSDFKHAMSLVKQSKCSPVLAVKSVGGASEKVASVFEARQRNDPGKAPGVSPNRPVMYSDQYAATSLEGVIPSELISKHYDGAAGAGVVSDASDESADDREMIVVDVVDPSAGQHVQKDIAALITMGRGGGSGGGAGLSDRRQIGFAAGERARFDRAWGMCLLFGANATGQKRLGDAYGWMMAFIMFSIVGVAVAKIGYFLPHGYNTHDATLAVNRSGVRRLEEEGVLVGTNVYGNVATGSTDGGDEGEALSVSFDVLWGESVTVQVEFLHLMLVLLPMASGVLLTLNNAFNPMQKRRAFEWGAKSLESEIYTYRTRALAFSPAGPTASSTSSADWAGSITDGEEALSPSNGVGWDRVGGEQALAKKFVRRIEGVSNALGTETALTHMSYPDEQPRVKVARLTYWGYCCAGYGGDDADVADGKNHASGGRRRGRKSNRREYTTGLEDRLQAAYQLPRTFEGEPSPLEHGRFETFVDDGYGPLTAEEYVMCRTKPALVTMQQKLGPLARRRLLYLALIYVLTASLVVCGAMHLDLSILLVQTAIGVVAMVLEHQRLEQTVVLCNRGVKQISHLLIWWDSLSFVEKRHSTSVDRLVRMTEQVLLAEATSFYDHRGTRGADEMTAAGDTVGS